MGYTKRAAFFACAALLRMTHKLVYRLAWCRLYTLSLRRACTKGNLRAYDRLFVVRTGKAWLTGVGLSNEVEVVGQSDLSGPKLGDNGLRGTSLHGGCGNDKVL